MLGNFPQAYSHVGLINSALNLSRRTGPAEERAESGSLPVHDAPAAAPAAGDERMLSFQNRATGTRVRKVSNVENREDGSLGREA
jgi:hypothetical protein